MTNPFEQKLQTIDPAVADLIAFEAERQARKLILIPSESPMPVAVHEAIGSVFENIYAEGYPDPRMRSSSEESILDYEVQLALYRRNSDRRRSKGVEYVDILETLACRRAAATFATPTVPAERIWANVQPLSGSPANNAVYSALLPIGSTIMGMDQMHGGHHTHGSSDNRSGQLYKAVSYPIDEETERLNYDNIEALARKHKPKLIIAGYTSYPWMPDWARFRKIADAVGAYLLADISHVAGMVAAGVAPSPIGHAHVVTFTTHKTLYGPRAACILTTNKSLAEKIDAAVFPGEQGGPHVSAMAGMAVIFKLAQQPEFVELQRQIMRNAKHMAAELERHGLRIPYGGTDTHMILVDCRTIRAQTGASPDGKKGTPLMGDPAARLLDLAGIVVNPNALPGDKATAALSGIRLGTPWITQRGFREPHIERLAEIIARLLKATRPHALAGRDNPIYHAKVDFDVLEKAKWDVVELARSADLPQNYKPSGYPHHYFLHAPVSESDAKWDVIEIDGPHARGFCNVAMTSDVYALGPGQCQQTWVLEPDGRLMGAGVLKRPGAETTLFQLLVHKSVEPRVANWLRALSDGFVDADPHNVFMKAPGPVVIRRLPHELAETWKMLPPAPAAFEDGSAGWATHKPYWIGNVPTGPAGSPFLDGFRPLPSFVWEKPAEQPLRRTALYDLHKAAGAKIVPFAGWEMPLQYTSLQEEHLTVRQAAGLFDVSHMGVFEFSGDNVHLFLNTIATNDVSLLSVGDSQYSCLLAPSGQVIDDIWIYRVGPERYFMAVNSANNDKDWAWVNAVQQGSVQIDAERPWVRALGTEKIVIRDLRTPECGPDMRVQLALQGPRSLDVLLALEPDADLRAKLMKMGRTKIIHGELKGYDLYITRTGYTGEPMAFEFFVHPTKLPSFWTDLLKAGEPFGLRPIGLAARDSLRTEAGLPLYGHEMAGPLNLNPADAGFAPYVKLTKPYFIGGAAYMQHEATRRSQLIRFRLDEERAPVPNQGDVIVNLKGRVVGEVTSCSLDTEGRLVGLGYVLSQDSAPGTRLSIYRLGNRHWGNQPLEDLKPGDRLQIPDDITVLPRFLNKK